MSRRLFRFNIEQLEHLFAEARDAESLKAIQDELKYRSTPKAAVLRSKVDAALRNKDLGTERTSQQTENESDDAPNRANSYNSSSSPPSPASTATATAERSDLAPGVPAKGNSHHVPLTETPSKLLELLSYLEHLAKLGEKPVFSTKEYQLFAFSEVDLKGQIGITHDAFSEDGQAWLRIERLQRQDPPLPPSEVKDWVVLSRDPFRAPKLLEILTRKGIEGSATREVYAESGSINTSRKICARNQYQL